jgi:ferredoxin-NADP reductase
LSLPGDPSLALLFHVAGVLPVTTVTIFRCLAKRQATRRNAAEEALASFAGHGEVPPSRKPAKTLTVKVPDWPGHLAGQRVEVRLTAADGYSAVRSYSIASAPNSEGRIQITVERLPNGEVSPYLTQVIEPGDPLEMRGPIGSWFVWRPEQTEPNQLIAGGSGIVPLMAMVRSRESAGNRSLFRLLYSIREPKAVFYKNELKALAEDGLGLGITYAYTRKVPIYWPRPPGRIDAMLIASAAWPFVLSPTCYVCGPASFVESVTELLTASGYDRNRIRTEPFGATGIGREHT